MMITSYGIKFELKVALYATRLYLKSDSIKEIINNKEEDKVFEGTFSKAGFEQFWVLQAE